MLYRTVVSVDDQCMEWLSKEPGQKGPGCRRGIEENGGRINQTTFVRRKWRVPMGVRGWLDWWLRRKYVSMTTIATCLIQLDVTNMCNLSDINQIGQMIL